MPIVNENKRLLLLSIILAACCLLAACMTIVLLYRAALSEAEQDLKVMVRSQSQLIQAVAKHDKHYELSIRKEFPAYDARRASIRQLVDAHSQFGGLGNHGEFVLARREGDRIVFLFRHDREGVKVPAALPWKTQLAEPMRRALSGDSGLMRGLDYEGNTVLAAYEPILPLGMGLVVKRSLEEVRAPFYEASLIALGLTILLVFAGVYLFKRITVPILNELGTFAQELSRQVEEQKRKEQLLKEQDAVLRQLAQVSPDVFWVVDLGEGESQVVFVSSAFEEIWQLPMAQVREDPMLWSTLILDEERMQVINAYREFLAARGPFDIEFTIRREDGSLRHIWGKGELICRDGRPYRAVGIAHDITRIKDARLQAEAERAELQRGFDRQKNELQRVIDLMSGREVRMAELKREIELLRSQNVQEDRV